MWFSHHLAEARLGLDVTDKMMKHETRCKLHPRKWLLAKANDMKIGDKSSETNEYRPLFACPKESVREKQ
jgi:hypothetical protein